MALDAEVEVPDVIEQPQDRRSVLAEAFEQLETSPPESKSDRARDDQGKFTAAKETVQGAPAAKTGEGAAAANAPPSPVEEPLWKRPPASWKKDFHDVWLTADPRLQEYAFQREEQMRAGVEPLLPKAQLADAINKVAEPYMNIIRGMNIDLPTAVGGLMKADHQLRTLPQDQRLQYFAQLGRSYGIDLSALTGQAPPEGYQPPDQNFLALQNELLTLKGELGSFREQHQTAAQQSAMTEINRFSQTVDHFEVARPFMLDLLQKGGAVTLEEAYEKTTGPDGPLHALIVASKQAGAVATNRVAADKAAKAARAAAVSLKGTTPGARTTTKAQSRREVLAEAFDSIDSRL